MIGLASKSIRHFTFIKDTILQKNITNKCSVTIDIGEICDIIKLYGIGRIFPFE